MPAPTPPRVSAGTPALTQARRDRLAASGPLAAWPAVLPFAAYALWWVLGIGDFVWILAALVMAASWLGRRCLALPGPLLVWGVFVLWVAATLPMNDTAGRTLGAIYRLLLYASAGVFAIHVFNARDTLSTPRVARSMTWFLAGMAACGYLALAAPQLVIHTPMSYIIPQGLQSNDLLSDMVVRRTSQWKSDAWVAQTVRPSAPFLYTNTWGNVYSLVLPFVFLDFWHAGRAPRAGRGRWWIAAVIVASVPPALSTLNRGMFIGLGVVALWVGIAALRRGAWRPVVASVAALGLVVAAWAASPFGRNFIERVRVTESTEDRGNLYVTTLEEALRSPLFGYGSPRPAEYPWLPSLGTQGQLWTVLYSHGFVGLALFMGAIAWAFVVLCRRRDPEGAILAGILLATLVETVFYGMMTGVMVSLVAAGLGLRAGAPGDPGRSGGSRGPGADGSA